MLQLNVKDLDDTLVVFVVVEIFLVVVVFVAVVFVVVVIFLVVVVFVAVVFVVVIFLVVVPSVAID